MAQYMQFLQVKISLVLSTKPLAASLMCLIGSIHVHVATGIIMSLFRYCGQTCYSFKKTG